LIIYTAEVYMAGETNGAANGAPLGLLGFGMTTVLLNLCNAGIIPLSVMILAMGLCLGGAAQVIAGIMEFKNKNTFGTTAFTAYGLFWWSLVLIIVNPFGTAPGSAGMGFYMVLWCVFTAFMFIGSLKHSRATQVVFLTLTVLFLLLAIAEFTGSKAVSVIAGWEGIVCGLSAIYNSVGVVINEGAGKKVLPL
jgi:uncharacterized protein